MIKRIVFLALAGLILVGCGVNCKGEPPRKAEYIQGGGHGMLYHFKLYDTRGDAGHTPSLKCINYRYVTSDVYSDKLGTVTASDIIWIDMQGNEVFSLNADQMEQMRMYLSMQKVVITGYINEYASENGEYPIK